MDEEAEKQLAQLWRDNAHPAAGPLFKLAQRRGLKVTAKEVTQWTKKQPSLQLLQGKREPLLTKGRFTSTTFAEKGFADLWDQSKKGFVVV